MDCLASQMEGAHLLSLHRHYFPKEYATSRASLRVRPPSAHSPREVEFIRLVGQRLFPVADIGFELADERLDYIPVETMALEDEQMDAWKPVWLILFNLVQRPLGNLIDRDSLAGAFPGVTLIRPVFVTEDRISCQVDWTRFFRRVAARYRGHAKGIRPGWRHAGTARIVNPMVARCTSSWPLCGAGDWGTVGVSARCVAGHTRERPADGAERSQTASSGSLPE